MLLDSPGAHLADSAAIRRRLFVVRLLPPPLPLGRLGRLRHLGRPGPRSGLLSRALGLLSRLSLGSTPTAADVRVAGLCFAAPAPVSAIVIAPLTAPSAVIAACIVAAAGALLSPAASATGPQDDLAIAVTAGAAFAFACRLTRLLCRRGISRSWLVAWRL